jgi:outer membrane cobalamin receptor
VAGSVAARASRLPLAVGCLVLHATSALAQDQPPPPPSYTSTVHARPVRDDDAQVIVLKQSKLLEMGAQDLSQALQLIPEIQVRQGGMGIRVDLRGAKQRSLLVLIDGVAMDEPYFGAFDVSAVPITDIVEIRLQLAPASPLEGPGGDGGILEIFTLHATGGRRLQAHVAGSSQPGGEAFVTGRAPLGSDDVGIRASAGARFGDPGYPILDMKTQKTLATFFDRLVQEYGSVRLEGFTKSGAHLTGDVWYGHRTFFIPPSDTTTAELQDITGENAARAVFGVELMPRAWRLAFGVYGEIVQRTTDFYDDYTLAKLDSHQDLFTARAGSALYADRSLRVRGLRATFSARLSVDGEGARIEQTNTKTGTGQEIYGELAVGAKLRWKLFRVEAAVGGLMPFENVPGTWPEAKVTLGYMPNPILTLLLIGARKGRLPTIRELDDPTQGNPKLSPEQTWHGELQAQLHPQRFVQFRLSAYVRQIDGFIRLDPSCTGTTNCKNVNLDTINVQGLETGFDLFRDRIFGGGVSYMFQDAHSATLGSNPIPNMPTHRVDAYVATTWRRRLGAMLRFRYVSPRFLQGAWLDRYETLDLYGWAKISANFRGSIHVDNLTDSQWLQLPGLKALPTTVTLQIDGVWE